MMMNFACWTRARIASLTRGARSLTGGWVAAAARGLLVAVMVYGAPAGVADVQSPSPPFELSPRGLDNVAAAARLLGYLRYFHPSDQIVGLTDWEGFTIAVLEASEPAVDAADLMARLGEVIAPVAPTVELWVGGPEAAPNLRPLPAEATTMVSWIHLGAGAIPSVIPRAQNIYKSRLERTPIVRPDDSAARAAAMEEIAAQSAVIRSLDGGVSCRIPISLAADSTGTLPHGASPAAFSTSEIDRRQITVQNRSTRLAGVAIAWAIFQHFYPYFDVVDVDWDAALRTALASAAIDTGAESYRVTLQVLVGALSDGHGNVMHTHAQPRTMIPLAVRWAGSELVVIGRGDGLLDTVRVGDVIERVDGRTADEAHAEVARGISAATEGWARHRGATALTIDLPTADPVALEIRRSDGTRYSVQVPRVPMTQVLDVTSKRPANGAEVAPGVVYFDLNGTDSAALAQAMPALAKAKGIIFDLRGYPNQAAYEALQHLTEVPITSARWCVPRITRPDREALEWTESGRWNMTPRVPRLQAKVAFLTDGRAISYAESIMGIVEHYSLGEIVGSTTAGTNGNVNPFQLPDGFSVSWTGMRVLKHDGSRHHGVGIAPTVPCVPTPEGIAEGRDEVLEMGIKVVTAQIAEAKVESHAK